MCAHTYLLEDPGVLEVVVHQLGDLRHPLVIKAGHTPGLHASQASANQGMKKRAIDIRQSRASLKIMIHVRE